MGEESRDIIVAYCGLVCSACGMYLKGKCEGCHSEKPMNRRCKTKACCVEKGYDTCEDCEEFEELRKCRKLNNMISKLFGLVFGINSIGNLTRIREVGLDEFKLENSNLDERYE